MPQNSIWKYYLLIVFFLLFQLFSSNAQRITNIDISGKEVTILGNSLISVKTNDGYRILKKNGHPVSKYIYEMVVQFSEQRAGVLRNGRWGYINEEGQEIIPLVYQTVFAFKNGNARVFSAKNGWELINKDGKVILNLHNWNYDSEMLRLFEERTGIRYKVNSSGLNKKSLSINQSDEIKRTTNGAGSTSANACPANIGFENGNFSNWTTLLGSTACNSNKNVTTLSLSNPTTNRHTIYSKGSLGVDYYGGFPTDPPDGNGYSVKLGNTLTGAQAEGMRYSITVPSGVTNYSISYQYAVVFQDPNHLPCEQPRFGARIFDPATNSYIACSTVEYISSSNIPGFFSSPIDATIKYKPWSSAFINLVPYAGKTIYIEFFTVDCTLGGHWGYAYFDIKNDCSLSASYETECAKPFKTTFTAPPGFENYRWLDDRNNLIGTSQNLVLNPGPPDGTNYKVELIPYNGAVCKDVIPIIVNRTELNANFNNSAPQCLSVNNFSFSDSSVIKNGTILTNNWDFGDGKTGIGSTVIHKYTAPGTYTVNMTVKANGQCTASIQKQVIIYANPEVSITADKPLAFCDGEKAILTAKTQAGSGSISSYVWMRNTIPIAGQTGDRLSVGLDGSYQTEVSNSNGCKDTSPPVSVTIYPLPVGNLLVQGNDTICENSTKTLTASGGTSYVWTLDGKVLSTVDAVLTVDQPGLYAVEAITKEGCKKMLNGNIDLKLIRKPTVSFSAPDKCIGLNVPFSNTSIFSASMPIICTWDFGDNAKSNLLSPGHVYTKGAAYTTSLKITPLSCPQLASSSTRVITIDEPLPNVRYHTINAVINSNNSLQARTFGVQYQWLPFEGLNNTSINNPVFIGNKETDYTIQISTDKGCITYDSLKVRVFTDADIQVPKAFTPNGDGHNDLLDVFPIGIKEFRLFRVFNRWGNLIYETSDPYKRWDGSFRGLNQPMETYVWVAEGVSEDGRIISKRGQTVLIR